MHGPTDLLCQGLLSVLTFAALLLCSIRKTGTAPEGLTQQVDDEGGGDGVGEVGVGDDAADGRPVVLALKWRKPEPAGHQRSLCTVGHI